MFCQYDLRIFVSLAGHLRNPRSEPIMKSTEGCMTFDGPFVLGYIIARVVLTRVCYSLVLELDSLYSR
jgi:hypothetical protein